MSSPNNTYNNTNTTNKSRSQTTKPEKAVRWGPVTEIPDSILREGTTSRPLPSRFNRRKPIIKPSTPFDLEIFHKNLWNMVHIAEKSLEVGRSVLSRLEDDFTLDKLLRMEERVLMRVSERNAGEYAWRTGIKLRFRVGKSQTKSRMHRKRAKKAEKAGLLFGEKPTGQLDC